jgi:hypothetical protein
MVVLMRLIVGTSLWRAQRHDRGQDGGDGDGGNREVPEAGRAVPVGVAKLDHDRVLGYHMAGTKGRRTPQHNHQAQDAATVNVWLPCGDRDQSNQGRHVDATDSNPRERAVLTNPASPIPTAPARASVARPGSAATALVLRCHRSPRTRVSQATPASTVARTCSSDSHGPWSPSIRRRHKSEKLPGQRCMAL